jgi:hypothetical protein
MAAHAVGYHIKLVLIIKEIGILVPFPFSAYIGYPC